MSKLPAITHATVVPPGARAGSAEDAITSRRSIRAFLDKPVSRDVVERLLLVAGRAPSGSNIQPWKVLVLEGAAKTALSAELRAAERDGGSGGYEYNYYPVEWREPYIGRRRATGWGLYGLLGITRDDKARMAEQHALNYDFFGAPVGLIFTIDRDMEQGSWLDYGMFLQNIMVAARGLGLDTCPQAAFARYHAIIQRRLAIPESQMVVCGMAIGYADPDAVVNRFWTERMALSDFVTFVDDDADRSRESGS